MAETVEVVWAKRRWFCTEEACAHGTFAEATVQVPRHARATARLREVVAVALIVAGRAAAQVARAHRVSWWLVQSALSVAASVLLPDVDALVVRRLGIDEDRYRLVRFYRDQAGAWK